MILCHFGNLTAPGSLQLKEATRIWQQLREILVIPTEYLASFWSQ